MSKKKKISHEQAMSEVPSDWLILDSSDLGSYSKIQFARKSIVYDEAIDIKEAIYRRDGHGHANWWVNPDYGSIVTLVDLDKLKEIFRKS